MNGANIEDNEFIFISISLFSLLGLEIKTTFDYNQSKSRQKLIVYVLRFKFRIYFENRKLEDTPAWDCFMDGYFIVTFHGIW